MTVSARQAVLLTLAVVAVVSATVAVFWHVKKSRDVQRREAEGWEVEEIQRGTRLSLAQSWALEVFCKFFNTKK